jgi:hypothetical protein
MKKTLLFLVAFLVSVCTIGQNTMISPAGTSQDMLSTSPDQFVREFENAESDAPSIDVTALVIPYTNATSTGNPAPSNGALYQRAEYLITAAEMAAAGFTNGMPITSIGWQLQVGGIGALTGPLNIYLKNTTDALYGLGPNWNVTDFVLVNSNASWTVPINANYYLVNFTGGSPFTYTGGAIYVAYEYSAPGGTVGTTVETIGCNNSFAASLRRASSATSLPTALTTSSAFRPVTIFSSVALDDVIGISNIYAHGKLPITFGTPSSIGVRVSNKSTSSATFDLTITVKDVTTSTIRFTATQTGITLGAGLSGVTTFNGWTPTLAENVIITASAVSAGETFTFNNSMGSSCNVNTNLFSYNYSTGSPPVGFGFTGGAAGIFASKYTMNGIGMVTGANLVISQSTTATGKSIAAVVLNSAGAIVGQSASYTILSTDLGLTKSFAFPTPVTFTNEIFYVGMLTSTFTAIYYPLGLFYDVPPRGGINYSFPAAGGTPGESTSPYRFGLEAQVAPFEGVTNPTAFTAVPSGAYQIDLSWALNQAGNAVMLAWNTTNTFGTPTDGTVYSVGNAIPGGGTVLSNGVNTTFNHAPLTPVTGYYYKAWSVNGSTAYSTGVIASATTPDIVTATIYPVNMTNGTGYVTNGTYLKKGPWMNISTTVNDTTGRGYLKFDVSGLPLNALITKATLNYYNFSREATSSGTNNIYPLSNDPIAAAGQALYTDCGDGLSLWAGAWGGTAPTWFSSVMNSNGINYVTDQLAAGWAGFGIVRGSTNLYRFSGYDDATFKPYLSVEYHIPTTPIFSVEPTSFDFEQINLGIQSLPKTFTIKNKGIGTITIDYLVLEGTGSSHYILTDGADYPKVLGAGESYTVSVVFKPTSLGIKTASLKISENENEHLVQLTGTGYLNAPMSLTAAAAPGSYADLNWIAPLPLEEIRYDDNTSETSFWVGSPSATTHRFFTKITIPVDGALTNISVLSSCNGPTTWESISLCPESGGVPDLASPIQTYTNIPVTSLTGQWILKSLTTPLNVTAGQNYYIVTQWPNGSTVGPFVGTDTRNDHSRCGWTNNGGTSWSVSANNLMMRAYMTVATDNNQSGNGRSLGSYTIHRGTARTALNTTIPGVSGAPYTDNTTAPSTLYYYMVTAEYSDGYANSDTVSVTTFAACTVPTDLTATNVTSFAADLGWNAGAGTAWQIEWGPAGFSHGTGTLVPTGVTNPYTLNGLVPGTQYDFYVRTDCGNGNLSLWAGPYPFTTLLAPIELDGMAYGTLCAFSCDGGINLAVTGGVPPYSFLWSSGSIEQNLTGLCAGTYSVTVTDANNSTESGSWFVDSPFPLEVAGSALNASCNGVADGSISVEPTGGTPLYTYLWSNGEIIHEITGLLAGTYTVTVTDANGCTTLNAWTVDEPAEIMVFLSKADVTCFGANNGSITVANVFGGTPPYNFTWIGPSGFISNAPDIYNLSPGLYSLNVTDFNNCESLTWIAIEEPLWIVVGPATTVDATCPTSSDGAITDLMVAGGTNPYTYQWSNGETTWGITGLNPGDYTVTVTDYNFCQQTGTFTVGQNNDVCANIIVTGDVTTTECYDALNTITVAGGGTTFFVEPTGHATFIAGSQILYKDGTKVHAGGYMLGKITLTGQFCSSLKITEVVAGGVDFPVVVERSFFSLFPNPTNGNFTLVQKGDRNYTHVKVEVISMNGEKVLTERMIGETRHEFHFADMPNGLYFIKVVADDFVATIKLVKTR